ncbi:MAG TPA: hypothetical protein VI759_09355 [Dehalococcoidia bacterium]|nr:hypothetical protein [Dehalococcoidia bacterium]
MKRVFRRRLLLPVLLVAFAGLSSSACDWDFKFGESAVENRTQEPLIVGLWFDCASMTTRDLDQNTFFNTANPGTTQRVLVITSENFDLDPCIVAATKDKRQFATAPAEIKKRYTVTRTAQGLQVRQTGEFPQGRTFDFMPPLWVFIVFAVVFGVGSVGGLFFTIQFFWGYYVRHEVGGKPIHPPPAPPPVDTTSAAVAPPQPIATAAQTPAGARLLEATATPAETPPQQTSAGAALIEATRQPPAPPPPVPGITPDANEISG